MISPTFDDLGAIVCVCFGKSEDFLPLCVFSQLFFWSWHDGISWLLWAGVEKSRDDVCVIVRFRTIPSRTLEMSSEVCILGVHALKRNAVVAKTYVSYF